MTAVANPIRKSKMVSFRPYVTVRKFIPISDPKAKKELYYSQRDLKTIKMKADIQIFQNKLQHLKNTKDFNPAAFIQKAKRDFKLTFTEYSHLSDSIEF